MKTEGELRIFKVASLSHYKTLAYVFGRNIINRRRMKDLMVLWDYQ